MNYTFLPIKYKIKSQSSVRLGEADSCLYIKVPFSTYSVLQSRKKSFISKTADSIIPASSFYIKDCAFRSIHCSLQLLKNGGPVYCTMPFSWISKTKRSCPLYFISPKGVKSIFSQMYMNIIISLC